MQWIYSRVKLITMRDNLERIVQKLSLGGRLLRSWPLKGGMSARMTVLEITTGSDDPRRIILRQPAAGVLHRNPDAARNEYRLLQMLHARGLAVPAPLLLRTSGETSMPPYLALEYIEGAPDFAPSNPLECARQMAEQLALIHSVEPDGNDLAFLLQPAGCGEQVDDKTPIGAAALDPEAARRALSAHPFPTAGCVTLLHGDFWPGNILWQDGRIAAVIDWEDARLGDPLSDLAIARLDIAWIYGWEAMHSFTQSYLSLMTLDDANLSYWDLCAALRLSRLVGEYLAGWAAYFQPYGRLDITPEHICTCFHRFIQQAM